MEASRTIHSDDLRLTRAIASGSTEAWHEFVQRYSNLIYTVACRYMGRGGDDDGPRDAYVEILEHFYRQGIVRYDGRAALSSWVMTVSRSRCLDLLRELHGRKRAPEWFDRLSRRDQEIYRRYYLESEPYPSIAESFSARGESLTWVEFVHALDGIEAFMDRRYRVRIAYELQAKSVGSVSGRLLEFLDHLRLEHEGLAETLQPDFDLLQAQTRQLLDRIRACVDTLDAQERQIVHLHYYKNLPASHIAKEMNLPAPRRVYTLIDRALASLRDKLSATWPPRDASQPPRTGGGK